ncbi:MAG TPA: hypothetical protein VE961_07615 [Pyrinomonadaceae bacterium]|nr:hypothetical protein [Pyrinomonadaceae bacterium]
MTGTQPPRQILRSVGAIFAGLVVIVVLDTGFDLIMHATGVFPPWFQPMPARLWLLAIAYRALDSIAGCYLTARLAPKRPLFHSLILGLIGVMLSTAGTLVTWTKGPEFGPKWYPITLVIIALPCAFIGGAIRQRQLE